MNLVKLYRDLTQFFTLKGSVLEGKSPANFEHLLQRKASTASILWAELFTEKAAKSWWISPGCDDG